MTKFEILQKQINENMLNAVGTAKGIYKMVTAPLILAIEHCLDESEGGGKGDNSLIALVMTHLKTNEGVFPKALIDAVSAASWQIAAVKMRYDSEEKKVSAKKDSKQWDAILGDIQTAALYKLKNEGLIAFKPDAPKKGKGSGSGSGKNSKVVDVIYEQPATEVIDIALKMKKDFPQCEDLQWYEAQINQLKRELERRYEALCELRKAAKGGLQEKVSKTEEAVAA